MFDVIKVSDFWSYGVIDTLSENEPVAAFLNKNLADSYCQSQNRWRSISCCKSSQSIGGWHHCPDCKGYYEKPELFTKTRKYFHEDGENYTKFEQVAHNQWSCVNGGWTGTVVSDDQLTMKHALGSVTYANYVEEANE